MARGVPPGALAARDQIIAAIRRVMAERRPPIVVALDGASGAGKSTIASLIAAELDVAVVQTDDFFAASVTSAEWDARDAGARAADAIDWERVRTDVLEPLRAGRPARWRAFDFSAGRRANGTYALRRELTSVAPAPVILLDGAYSAGPGLAGLLDLSVLVDVPREVRQARLAEREDPGFLADWHARWDAAEAFYRAHVRPPSSFDLVVAGSTGPE